MNTYATRTASAATTTRVSASPNQRGSRSAGSAGSIVALESAELGWTDEHGHGHAEVEHVRDRRSRTGGHARREREHEQIVVDLGYETAEPRPPEVHGDD